ncbi:AMP-binding protein [Sphaerothrix gracilis]|uniref:AMP-binding protein n=1 Tax=Sphaerothrix gracilis TaxID=3151835 RepID=UPI0031FD27AF
MVKQLSLEALVQCGLTPETAAPLRLQINPWLTALSPTECWQRLTQEILRPDQPWALHQRLYDLVYADWDARQGPPPAWIPTQTEIERTNIATLMRAVPVQSYPELHAWSVQQRDQFWQQMVQRLGIHFQQPYSQILDLSRGVESPVWLVDARLNIAESCFQAAADAPAILFQPEEGALAVVSYGELRSLAHRVANGLVEAGLQPGDAIALDLPMTVEAVAIYLGIILAGGTVVAIADSFAPEEIATRLRLAPAKAIFTQDFIRRGGKCLPLYDRVIEANGPSAVVIASEPGSAPKLRAGDRLWSDFLSPSDRFSAVPASPCAPIHILFSSGTTGAPKAIPWTHTTPIKCAADGHLHQDIHPGDVVAWPTNLGWMMGPWLIYASLINRAAIALYEGAPTTRAFGQFVEAAHVTMLGVVPSLVSAWQTSGCLQGLDWHRIKAFSSTGECSNPHDMLFLMSRAGYRPVIEYCGGTEIGGGYVTGTLVQPAAPATFTTPALGLDLVILNADHQPATQGEVFIVPPSIGLSTALLNRDHHQVYFANTPSLPTLKLRRHGDQMERLANGYYRAWGRVDDTMNLAGIKVSAVEIEQVLNAVPGVRETAAIAVSPSDGGPSQLVIYAVLTSENKVASSNLQATLQTAIRQHLNPLFKIHALRVVAALPRTASNKVMRRLLRRQFYDLLQPIAKVGNAESILEKF